MTLSIRPTGARVIIKPEQPEDISLGGVIIPDTSKTPTLKGIVIEVGPGTYTEDGKLIPPCVEPGDFVLVQAFSGAQVKANGEEYLIINDRDIICIIDDKNIRVENNATILNAAR